MKIVFVLETLGYIAAKLSIGNNPTIKIYHASDYGDKFQDLLNKLAFLHEIIKDKNMAFFPFESDIIWEDNLISFKWEVKMESVNSVIKIIITELDQQGNYEKKIVQEQVSPENLYDDIYTSLDSMLNIFGLAGYKKLWEVGNFPIYEYMVLKSEKKNITLNQAPLYTENGIWKNTIPSEEEMYLVFGDKTGHGSSNGTGNTHHL